MATRSAQPSSFPLRADFGQTLGHVVDDGELRFVDRSSGGLNVDVAEAGLSRHRAQQIFLYGWNAPQDVQVETTSGSDLPEPGVVKPWKLFAQLTDQRLPTRGLMS